MTTSAQVAVVLDARGKSCPAPVLDVAKTMRSLEPGSIMEVLATDRGSRSDIPAWVDETGHQLLSFTEENGVFRFVIKKMS